MLPYDFKWVQFRADQEQGKIGHYIYLRLCCESASFWAVKTDGTYVKKKKKKLSMSDLLVYTCVIKELQIEKIQHSLG